MQDVPLYGQRHPAHAGSVGVFLFIRNSFIVFGIFFRKLIQLKRADIPRSTERLEIRLTPAEKKYLKLKAQKSGFKSMADFVMSLAKGIPLHDSRYDKVIFDTLDNIAFELNKTGININQATRVLNIQKIQGGLNNETFKNFTVLLSEFNNKQDLLFETLSRIRFQ